MKKFILYTLAYILITFTVAFGTVTTNNLLVNKSSAGYENQVQAEATDGEKFLDKFVTLGKANFSVMCDVGELTNDNSTSSKYGANSSFKQKARVSLTGELDLPDLENFAMNAKLEADIEGTKLNAEITYLNGTIYLSSQDTNIKLETSNIMQIVSFVANLGLNQNVELPELNTDELLQNFQNMRAKKRADGSLLLQFKISDNLKLNFYTDENFTLKKIQANNIQFGSTALNLYADLKPNDAIVITNPEDEKEFVDLSSSFEISSLIDEIISNKQFGLEFNLAYNGTQKIGLNGAVNVDFNSGLQASLQADLSINDTKIPVNIYLQTGDLYLNIGSLKFMVDKSNLNKTINAVNVELKKLGVQGSFIDDLLAHLQQLDFNKILKQDLSNIISIKQTNGGGLNLIIYGKPFGIDTDLNLQLQRTDDTNKLSLSNLKVLNGSVDLILSVKPQANIPQFTLDGYYKLEHTSEFVTATIRTLNNILNKKVCTFNFNCVATAFNTTAKVNGIVSVDFKTDLKTYFNFDVNVCNKTFKMKGVIVGEQIYLHVDNLKFTFKFKDIENLTSQFSKMQRLGAEPETGTGIALNVAVQLLNTLNNYNSVEMLTGLNLTQNALTIKLNKAVLNTKNDVNISLNYTDKLENFKVEEFETQTLKLSSSLTFADTSYKYDYTRYSYCSLSNNQNLIDAIENTLTNFKTKKGINLNVDATLTLGSVNLEINGTVAISETKVLANLTVKFGIITVQAKVDVLKQEIYIANLFGGSFKITFEQAKGLILKLAGANSFEELMPSGNGMDFGAILKGDLSTLDLDILKDIRISSNQTELTFNKEKLGSTQNPTLILNYNSTLQKLELNNFISKNFGLKFKVELM